MSVVLTLEIYAGPQSTEVTYYDVSPSGRDIASKSDVAGRKRQPVSLVFRAGCDAPGQDTRIFDGIGPRYGLDEVSVEAVIVIIEREASSFSLCFQALTGTMMRNTR